jgi:hypothetical protein
LLPFLNWSGVEFARIILLGSVAGRCARPQLAALVADPGVEVLAFRPSTTDTFVAMRSVLIGFALGVLFALPWIAAAVWIRWRVLRSENEGAFPTQATSLRSFSLR